MEILDVIRNLEKWGNWDYKCYPLSKAEAESIIKFFGLFEGYYKALKGEEAAADGLDCD